MVFRPGQSTHPSIKLWKMVAPVAVKAACICCRRWLHSFRPAVGLGMSGRPLGASGGASGIKSAQPGSTGPVEAPLVLLVSRQRSLHPRHIVRSEGDQA